MKYLIVVCMASLIFATSCDKEKNTENNMELQPPKADKIAKNLEMHDDVRVDEYYWLNQKDDPEVIDYLERENDYYAKMTADTDEFKEALFEELKGRIKEDDESVPYLYNGYYYITRYEKGKNYPVYTRKKGNLDAEEEVLFNVNEMAEGYAFYNLRGINISPDNKWAAFGVDTLSRRKYNIHIKNLETGEVLDEVIPLTTGTSTWANDNKTLFYTHKDEQTLRSSKIYRHVRGTDIENDVLIFSEDDETFGTYVYKTKSKKYLVIGSYSTLTSEFQILKADDPEGQFKVFQPRVRGLEYNISHFGDHFYILTNKDGASNFKLMKTSENTTEQENWEEVIAHRDDVLLEDVETFRDFLVISERSNGLNKIKISRWDESTDPYYLPFDNETYTAYTMQNMEFDSEVLRYGYNSLTTPASVIDFNMNTRDKEIKKEVEVLGGKFDKNNYESKRVWATGEDGTKIPISMVYRKGMEQNGDNPLLLYGYGSYGSTIDPYFSSQRLTLLDRGFIFAIAHVRGSEYLGRQWYEDGKLLKKMNTFTDFVDATKYLISEKYTSTEHMYASGGSAGGLLMGAILNISPEFYNGVVAAVPFVDVVTTMLDDSIPLTTGEYDEWGNPNKKEYYEYMKSYSPYDNVKKVDYPNIFVTTGYHDSQVQYWEPAKWVAKLREYNTSDNVILFHTNMEAGHGGASGRFEALKELAMDYAFLLSLEGIKE
ncbi:MAG: S9 family peptidase [Bacteroidia bacterium]|nr:S9 family peptidase [Bacteroidia bacterium]MBT8276556.1 S9 family peptidase [Bacteroidia bacterium]NNF31368.1 S9 family peptidase [Flavobacteriaceae bacterium]NNK54358.1 S9 family peptidase [Flavobacteriaceae bacterium]NNM09095.1 S9 family peptidase [Flavobacteriaceae bacterium]